MTTNTAVAADIIAAARMRAHKKHPYLSHILFRLSPVPAPGLHTLAVDASWRLFYDPATVVAWHQEEEQQKLDHIAGGPPGHHGVAGVVAHEIGHVLRDHFSRKGERDQFAWNFACDQEINDDIIASGWRLPGSPLLPSSTGAMDGLTAEEYFRLLPDKNHPREFDNMPGEKPAPGCGGRCGGACGNPTEWEKEHAGASTGALTPPSAGGVGQDGSEGQDAPTPLPEPVSETSQAIARRLTAIAIQEHVRQQGRGSVPAGMQAWAEQTLLPPVVRWQREMASHIGQAIAWTAGAVQATWTQIGRRSLHSAGKSGQPILPKLRQPIPQIGVVLDTSGSMAGEPLRRACSEVVGIVRASHAPACYVYACDAAVHAAALVRSQADLAKVNFGGGGTDMRPGFAKAVKDRCNIIIVLTDGDVGDSWPTLPQCQGRRVIVGLVADHSRDVPAHLRVCRIPVTGA